MPRSMLVALALAAGLIASYLALSNASAARPCAASPAAIAASR